MDEKHIVEGEAIFRQSGSSFYIAARLLPKRIRRPTYILYAFSRVADEIVDDPGDYSPAEQRTKLEHLREEALGHRETEDPIHTAFNDVRQEYGIPKREVDLFIDAMAADIRKDRYATHDELASYTRGSAAAIGYMMAAVMGANGKSVRPHAGALGVAFQQTNILRDVREDVTERDRVYIPRTTLHKHGATIDQIEDLDMSRSVAAAVAAELHRVEYLYRRGVAGIKRLPRDCQFAVLLASVLYAEHLHLIRECGMNVLAMTPQLSATRKLSLIIQTAWWWKWRADPEEVFARVSAVPYPNELESKKLPSFLKKDYEETLS